MADKDELEITIDKDGNVTIKVIGGDGTTCVELTKELEEALGLVDKRTLTEQYYQEPVDTEAQVEQGE
ncbi:MAG: DUF2997 domain-containing protein [Planctomycetota bacterium]